MCFFGSHKPQKTHGGGKHGFCAPQKYIWKGVAHIHVFFVVHMNTKTTTKWREKRISPSYTSPSPHLPLTTPTPTTPPRTLAPFESPTPPYHTTPITLLPFLPSTTAHLHPPLPCHVLSSCLFISSHVVFYSIVLSCHVLSWLL